MAFGGEVFGRKLDGVLKNVIYVPSLPSLFHTRTEQGDDHQTTVERAPPKELNLLDLILDFSANGNYEK